MPLTFKLPECFRMFFSLVTGAEQSDRWRSSCCRGQWFESRKEPAQSEVRVCVSALPWRWRWWRWARRCRPAVCGRIAYCCGPPCGTSPPGARGRTPRGSSPSPPPRAALWHRCRRCSPPWRRCRGGTIHDRDVYKQQRSFNWLWAETQEAAARRLPAPFKDW